MKNIYFSLAVSGLLMLHSACGNNQDQLNVNLGRTSNTVNDIESVKSEIRKTVMGETEAYYKQDFESWKSKFVDAEYFRQHGYWEGYDDKVKYYNGFDTLRSFKKDQFENDKTLWKGSYEKVYNESFRIYGDAAWYTYEQDSYDGKTNELLGKSVETRILEKHNGQWKIAYLGFYYLPKQKDGL